MKKKQDLIRDQKITYSYFQIEFKDLAIVRLKSSRCFDEFLVLYPKRFKVLYVV